jgi:hypothetical protein
MKSVSLLFVLATSLLGEVRQHSQTPWVDAYAVSTTNVQPDIPGMGKPEHIMSVSFTSTDDMASAFVVYIRVILAVGSRVDIRRIVGREAGDATWLQFSVGIVEPVGIDHFYIVRLHPETADQIIQPIR